MSALTDQELLMIDAVRASVDEDRSLGTAPGRYLADVLRLSLDGRVCDLDIGRVLLVLSSHLNRSAEINPYVTGMAQRMAVAAVDLTSVEWQEVPSE